MKLGVLAGGFCDWPHLSSRLSIPWEPIIWLRTPCHVFSKGNSAKALK